MNKVFHSRHFKGLVYGTILLALITTAGTLGYHHIGRPDATWINSFYMTFITITTIGYGETVDLTHHPYGRLFTVVVAIFGIGCLSYLFSTLVAVLVDADFNAGLRIKRMEKDISKLSGHYIVCGIGRVGSNVASELTKTQRQYVVIEEDRKALDSWLERHPHCLHLHNDAADDDALQQAGVERAAGVFAVTADDSHNLMVSMSVKLINPKARVVVRLHDIRNSRKARKAGADEVVSPDFTGGMRIASAMVRPHVVNFMDQMLYSDDSLRVEEITVPAHFAPCPLSARIPRSPHYLLMAVHEQGRWVFNPSDEHLIHSGTTLVLMTSPQGRTRVESLLRDPA